MEIVIKTLVELEEEAQRFAATLVPSPGRATLVTLSGELGAGKTAFTKAFAKALGVEEVVTSPTFVLEKIYQLGIGGEPANTPKFKRLVHIDAYRLEKGGDLAPLGFDEIMQDPSTLMLLEWPEKVADVLPPPSAALSFVVNGDGSRTITYG